MTLNQALEILSANLDPSIYERVSQDIIELLKFKNMTLDDLENEVEETLEYYSR